MDLKKILELFQDMSLPEIRQMKLEISKIESSRGNELLKNIQNNDLESIKKILNLGVNWEEIKFWDNLFRLNIETVNNGTLNYLFKEEIPNVKISNYIIRELPTELRVALDIYRKEEGLTLDSKYILREILKKRMEKTLIYGQFSEDIFLAASKHIEKNKFNGILPRIIKRFGEQDISQGFEKVHEYIVSNKLVNDLLNNIIGEASLNFFINKKEYKEYFNNCSELEKQILMNSAVSQGIFVKVKVFHNLGISISNCSNSAYSNLFMKTDEKSHILQEYIINNIDNICIGRNVILKTMLHKTYNPNDEDIKISLIHKALERYLDEEVKNIPNLLNKREPTQRVLYTQKYYEHRILKIEIDNSLKSREDVNQQPGKKMKI